MNKAVVLLGSKQLGIESKTHDQALKTGLLVPKIQDWASERSLVEQFTPMVLDSDKNVVIICHEKELSDKDGTVLERVPLLTGKSVDTIPLMFDEVYHTKVERAGLAWTYKLQPCPDGIVRAGSRLGVPDNIEWDYDTVKGAMDKV